MKISPYLQFNGNCAEAIALYEKAFGVKAEIYKESEGFISHAEFNLGDAFIGLSDTPQDEGVSTFGNGGISISISFTDIEELNVVFEKLSAEGKVFEKPDATEWCECFCTLEDKFGINWSLMCGEKA
jgi:PhnB protein